MKGACTILAAIPGLPANLHWGAPWVLGLLIVPLAMLVLRARRRPAVVLPASAVIAGLPRTLRQRLLWLPRLLLMLGMCAAIIAVARPQLGEGKVLTSTDAVAIQLVVDRSKSMESPMEMDGREMSRMDVVKRVVHEFLVGNDKDLAGRPADLIGLVEFGTYADTVCPLVRDPRALEQLVGAIRVGQTPQEGNTAIGDGLALAAARLRTAEQDLQSRHKDGAEEDFRIKSKVIILLTDGADNASQVKPIDAAKLAADWGIKVYTIGISSDSYRVFRSLLGEQRIPVPSDMDAATLQAIADATGGGFFRAQDGNALRDVYSKIDQLEKSTVKTVDYTDYTELFPPAGAASLGLLALQMLLSATWLRRTP